MAFRSNGRERRGIDRSTKAPSRGTASVSPTAPMNAAAPSRRTDVVRPLTASKRRDQDGGREEAGSEPDEDPREAPAPPAGRAAEEERHDRQGAGREDREQAGDEGKRRDGDHRSGLAPGIGHGVGLASIIASEGEGLSPIIASALGLYRVSDGLSSIIASEGDGLSPIIASVGAATVIHHRVGRRWRGRRGRRGAGTEDAGEAEHGREDEGAAGGGKSKGHGSLQWRVYRRHSGETAMTPR